MKRGNCYVTCEALYHLLGGKAAGWKPMTLRHEGDTHWYLIKLEWDPELGPWLDRDKGLIKGGWVERVRLDPTVSQFKTPPDYSKGRGRGFLTKKPSKRARAMMQAMVWQDTPKRKRKNDRSSLAHYLWEDPGVPAGGLSFPGEP